MRKLFIAIAITASSPTMANTQYLVPSTPDKGYVGLVGKSMAWGDQGAAIVGAHGAMAVHERFYLGLEAASLSNQIKLEDEDAKSPSFVTYGVYAEGRLYDWQFLTATLNVGMGTGDASYRRRNTSQDAMQLVDVEGEEWSRKASGFRYNEGQLNLLIHLNKRADVGLGYGFVNFSGTELPGYSDDDLSGSVATMFLRKVF